MKAIYSTPQELKASVKDVDGKKGIVTGYFASFGNVDSDGDIIVSGAFSKSVTESGPISSRPRIKHLLNHRTTEPLGEIQILQEDRKGLYYESQIGIHNLGVDFVKMVESGLITEHSIGFETTKWRHHDTLTVERWGNEYPVREITEVKLWEGSSLTAWGANEDTPLTGLKSMTNEQVLTRLPLLKSAIKNGTFTDATFEILVAELTAIETAFKALTGTTQPDGSHRTTEPNGRDLVDAIKSFSLQLN